MPNPAGTSRPGAPFPARGDALREVIRVARLYPQLWIRVWAAADGVHLTATLIPEDGGRQTSNRQLIRAVWQPDEVTEQLVVEWAYRALRKLLQDEYEGTGHL